MAEIRDDFQSTGDGLKAAAARSALVDGLVLKFWQAELASNPRLSRGVAVCAIGGFGRGQLFPGWACYHAEMLDTHFVKTYWPQRSSLVWGILQWRLGWMGDVSYISLRGNFSVGMSVPASISALRFPDELPLMMITDLGGVP